MTTHFKFFLFRNKRLKITQTSATKTLVTTTKDLMMWGMIKECLRRTQSHFLWMTMICVRILKEKSLKVVVLPLEVNYLTSQLWRHCQQNGIILWSKLRLSNQSKFISSLCLNREGESIHSPQWTTVGIWLPLYVWGLKRENKIYFSLKLYLYVFQIPSPLKSRFTLISSPSFLGVGHVGTVGKNRAGSWENARSLNFRMVYIV